MNPWSLYIIRCRDGELYTGVTTDVNRRFVEHQGGGPRAAKYLKGKAPLQLVYQELVGSRSEALKREIQIKKLSRQQKLALLNASRATAG
ncbi:GIY-YIG nuclease family protein [Shewanella sp.]|jgi:putative endonuclease|uniref:GIY-YIG nuclease family protein n=1 Tax=Shewanella sp. TaxID=50422 RepID=UPI003D1447FC